MRPDLDRPGDFSPYPNNVRGSFFREIEKQQIREEIIAAEERRHQLEAEVRMEMMMEREMALGGTHGFPIFSGPQNMLMDPRLPISNHPETRFRDAMPFSRGSGVRITEVKATPEVNKERIILLPKPEGNVSGVKRKATTPPATEVSMPCSDPKKCTKERLLHCELCQVSATGEKAMKEHFQGKKHKSREARQLSQVNGQNFAIGLFSRKAINSPNKLTEITKDREEEPKEEIVKKDEVAMTKKVEKDSLKFKFWCPMCKIGAFTEKVMNAHKRGKKHTSLLLESLNSRASAPENRKVSETATEKEVSKAKSETAAVETDVKNEKEKENEKEKREGTDNVALAQSEGTLLLGWIE